MIGSPLVSANEFECTEIVLVTGGFVGLGLLIRVVADKDCTWTGGQL